MANAPVIEITGTDLPLDSIEAYNKRLAETNVHFLLTEPSWRQLYRYQIIHETPGYPTFVTIWHFENFEVCKESILGPVRKENLRDVQYLLKKFGGGFVWYTVYEIEKSFCSKPIPVPSGAEDTRIEGASVVHFEALKLTPEQNDRYNRWFEKWGYDLFVPLIMKTPGLIAYDRFKWTGWKGDYADAREIDYPANLSLLYFENIKAFEDYEKSLEVAAFRKVQANDFPEGLRYWYYAQFELKGSRTR